MLRCFPQKRVKLSARERLIRIRKDKGSTKWQRWCFYTRILTDLTRMFYKYMKNKLALDLKNTVSTTTKREEGICV